MADKGALQRQESWLGWWSSIPRLICDRHIIFWNSYSRFHQEWVLLRAEPTRLHSLNELPWKNLLQMNCCIICCAYRSLSVSQFSRSVMSESLQPHGLQHARLPCPSPTPGACSNSCQSSWWCYPTISSCHPLLLLPSIFPRISVFSNESVL